MLPPLEILNAEAPEEFVAHLAPLFETASPLLAALAARRPFADAAALFAAAREIAAALPAAEQRAILDAHPAIGAPKETLSDFSRQEQSHGASPDDAIAAELAALNAEYRARHGFTFVVFVNRRPQAEILPILRERLTRSTDDELATALGELVAIAEDRARQSWESEPSDPGRFAFVTLADAFYQQYEVPPLPVPFTPAQIATVLPGGHVPFSLVADNVAAFLASYPQARAMYAPLMARVAFEAGIYEGREGRFAAARAYLERAVDHAPDNLTVRGNLGRACLDTGDDGAAMDAFGFVRAALAGDGFLPDVWLGGVAALDRLGRGDERDEWARDYVRRSARFFPERGGELFAHAVRFAEELHLSDAARDYFAAQFGA